jgi:cell division protein FtsW (lipid II flippase)
MRRESLFPFLPAVIAALTDVLTAATVAARQPDYPGTLIVFQVVMCGAALLAAVPNKWMRFVGFVLLLAGMFITGEIQYLPTFFAVVWSMVRDGRPAVQSEPGPAQWGQTGKRRNPGRTTNRGSNTLEATSVSR